MKLLAITSYYKPAYVYGGPVRCTAVLYEGLTDLGIDITVITTDSNGNDRLDMPLLEPLNIDGVQVIYCPIKPRPGSAFYSPTQIEKAKQLIQHADIINLQTFWGYATPPLSRYCQRLKVPYFVSLHGQLMDYAMRTQWTKRLKKLLFLYLVGYNYLNGASGLHCTSNLEAENLQAYPIHAPTFIIPNGIDVDWFARLPARGQLRASLDIPADALVMLMLGRIHPKKRPDIAVAALAKAQQLQSDVHLLIVGPDESNMQPPLIRQARQAGCAGKLHFTDVLKGEALLQAIADSDLFIMPSEPHSENFGMSAAEAMAAGLPIIVSEGVPIGQWAVDANAGRQIPCTVQAFVETTHKLLRQPHLLHEMGQRGKKLAQQAFDKAAIGQQMLNQFESILSTGRPIPSKHG